MGKLTISMAIFNSYFDITRGYLHVVLVQKISRDIPMKLTHEKLPGKPRGITQSGHLENTSAPDRRPRQTYSTGSHFCRTLKFVGYNFHEFI